MVQTETDDDNNFNDGNDNDHLQCFSIYSNKLALQSQYRAPRKEISRS